MEKRKKQKRAFAFQRARDQDEGRFEFVFLKTEKVTELIIVTWVFGCERRGKLGIDINFLLVLQWCLFPFHQVNGGEGGFLDEREGWDYVIIKSQNE